MVITCVVFVGGWSMVRVIQEINENGEFTVQLVRSPSKDKTYKNFNDILQYVESGTSQKSVEDDHIFFHSCFM